MDPSVYIPLYLEREYLSSHPDLTSGARELVHEDVAARPERYATTEHARALIAYAEVHRHLHQTLKSMEELPDEEFERKRSQLFAETRLAAHKIAETDRLCIDAQLLSILLAEVSFDACLHDLLVLEGHTRDFLEGGTSGFDAEAEHLFTPAALSDGRDAAELTATNPIVVGWLHTIEAISQLSLASARYRAAMQYARIVMRAEGYPNRAEGTVLLALARLEDEEGFFAFAREVDQREREAHAQPAWMIPHEPVDDSPWYLLARTLLLYKLGRRRAARRALRDFANRCDGGAFFLLNPTYLTPYLPARPTPQASWSTAHQAVWEADGIIADTPDFVVWAESVEGVVYASEAFADRNGF